MESEGSRIRKERDSAQQLMPVYEPLFSDNSYGYRPGKSAKDAITNEFDQESEKRTAAFVRYTDDIVILEKSDRAARRLLETGTRYFEMWVNAKLYRKTSVGIIQISLLSPALFVDIIIF